MRRGYVSIVVLVIGLTPVRAEDTATFFEKAVRPVLATQCFGCHGRTRQKAGLRLDSRAAMLEGGDSGPAIVPGKPESSLLVRAVRYHDRPRMPPKHRLHEEEITALATWVRQGAPWPKTTIAIRSGSVPAGPQITARDRQFWSFRPIQEPALPPVRNARWCRTSVDRFILAQLESRGLAPAPAAERRTLLRRVTFDLTGLPPTPAEVDAFVHDNRPDAYARVVDRLLASPAYGERWGRHWLDVARYGEDQAHTFAARLYPFGYRYRDWVVRAFNSDMPYDRFILEQVAGDLLPGPGRAERLAALGFFAVGPVYYGDRKRFDQFDDRIDTLSRGFLGLTVACARCHDHKFDPIPTRDYYALASVFASTDYVEVPAVAPAVVAAYQRAQDAASAQRKRIQQFLRAHTVGGQKQASLTKNATAGMKPKAPALSPDAQRQLATMKAELRRLEKQVPPHYPIIHSLKDAAHPVDLRICIRGNPERLGEPVSRHFLSILSRQPRTFTHGSGRLELAQAIASPDNPLTARVMVNRIWQHHFGVGLVRTASNFGALGDRPTHPELLDYLARRFIASGWSIKRLHRLILLSSTYQLSSRYDAKNAAKDAENRYLWRMNRRRLEAEAWRDGLLAVAGRLNRTVGGPSRDLNDSINHRRTLYGIVSRHDLNGLLRLFDFPDPNITSAGRTTTTVPLQQLFVLNSPFMIGCARALVARLQADPGKDDAARIRGAFALLFGRPPTARELRLGLDYLHGVTPTPQHRLTPWERYAQVLLSTNEFLYVD